MTHLNKNCLLRLLMSMVSISITWMSLNPDRARFARISHPKPPAPMTKILHWFLRNALTFTIASAGEYRLRDSMGLSYFFTGKERRIGSWARTVEDLIYVIVSGLPVRRVCRPVQGHHSWVVLVIGAGEGVLEDRRACRILFPTNTPRQVFHVMAAPTDLTNAPLSFSGHECFRHRLVLSILSGRPVRIDKIRSADANPGLRGPSI